MASKDTRLQIIVDAQNRTQGTFNELENNLSGVQRSYGRLQSTLTAIGTAGTVAFGGLSLLTKNIIAAGVGIEQTTIAFETMLGSAELAQKTLSDLASFAAKTPFELLQLEDASKRLLAYGITAEDLIPTLTMLGDVTAGVGMDKLPQLILAFGQVSAATKLTGMELRQFSESGVPLLGALVDHFNSTAKAANTVTTTTKGTAKEIEKLNTANTKATEKLLGLNITLEKQNNRFQDMISNNKQGSASYKNLELDIENTRRKIAETELAILNNSGALTDATQIVKSFGAASQVTAADVQEMISAGEVSFEDVKAALGSLTAEGGRFHELMAKQSQSLGGLWSTLKDNIQLTARAMGEEMLPYLKPIVQELIRLTGVVGQFVKDNPQLAAMILAGALAFTALLAVLLPISLALPGLIMLFTGLAAVFGALIAISAPVLLAIGGIIVILGVLAANGYMAKEAWQDVWLGIKVTTAEAANAVIGVVESMINFIINGVNQAIAAINRVVSMAQRIPGVGKHISGLSLLSPVSFSGIDTNALVSADIASRSAPGGNTIINITGNTLLDDEAGVKLGDSLLNRLRLSNQF